MQNVGEKLIDILVVEDHALFRELLALRLADEPAIGDIRVARNADQALTLVTTGPPDVILADIEMPGMSCFDAMDRIHRQYPHTQIAFLSAYWQNIYIERALAVGAAGYLTKTELLDRVIDAIIQISAGGVFFSKEVQDQLRIDNEGRMSVSRSRISNLTEREKDILCFIANGLTKKQIASYMSISPHTIGNHVASIMKKLDIHDRVELARFAIREGISSL